MENSKKTTSDDAPLTLLQRMKEATLEAHSEAEQAFGDAFMQPGQDLQAHHMLLEGLHFVYNALENELDKHQNSSAIAPFYFPDELRRVPAINKDLKYFFGSDWRTQMKCRPEMMKYAERIRYAGENKPELLLAHCYVRYFGDMSGGRIIQRIMKKNYKHLNEDAGLAFFDFSNIASIENFKRLYSSRVEGLGYSEETKQEVIKEAALAFQLNMNTFKEIVLLNKVDNRLEGVKKWFEKNIGYFLVVVSTSVLTVSAARWFFQQSLNIF